MNVHRLGDSNIGIHDPVLIISNNPEIYQPIVIATLGQDIRAVSLEVEECPVKRFVVRVTVSVTYSNTCSEVRSNDDYFAGVL